MSYKLYATAEELGIQGIIQNSLGMFLVLDKEPFEEDGQVLIIPFAWDHRRVVNIDEL